MLRLVTIPCHADTTPGWRCTRGAHDRGPCALTPRWWNLRDRHHTTPTGRHP